MNITFETPDKVNGLLTITIEKEDYQPKVDKALKDYRKRANVPGFRPGMVPMDRIKRQFGMSAKIEEVNRLLGESMTSYLRDNKIHVLGEPLASEQQEAQDLATDGPFTFKFDIAVAPDVTIALTGDDEVPYYTIKVDDTLIDQQVQMLCQRNGEMEEGETFEGTDRLIGDLRQLDSDGNTLEGGITVSEAQLMPSYMKDDEQKKLFEGCKGGDIITFNPKKAYPDNDAEVAALLNMKKEEVQDLTSDFSYQVTSIKHYAPATVDQKLFDRLFGEGKVNSEEEFRQKISEMLERQFAYRSDFKFLNDLRDYCEKKVGELTFPKELLKRFLKQKEKEKGNEKDNESLEKELEESLKSLKWHLIKAQLVSTQGIKVEDAELKLVAKEQVRQQFAQYGMNDVPDDVLEKYSEDLLKKRENVESYVDIVIEQKLVQTYKQVVKLAEKTVTVEEFGKMEQGE